MNIPETDTSKARLYVLRNGEVHVEYVESDTIAYRIWHELKNTLKVALRLKNDKTPVKTWDFS